MKLTRILLMAGIVLMGEADCFGQAVVWSGNGDGTSWSNPQNWIGQQAPGPANNVFITNGTGSNVIISSSVAVESVLCGKALTISGGSLAISAGPTSLQGPLILSGNATLSANGSGTTLTAGGSVSADGANFEISAGAVVTLPGLQNYSGGCDVFTWSVAGPNSVLNLPGLTNMTQANCGSGGRIQATSGGQVLATNLASIDQDGDPQPVQADGTNSLVDFSSLETTSGAFKVTFEASDGGTNWVPRLIGGSNACVTLNPGGALPVAQMQQLGGITATGTTNTFSSLTNFDGGNISLGVGASVTAPELRNYSAGCGRFTWVVVGPGSVWNLPGRTNMTQPYCGIGGQIQAGSGGQVLATNLASIDQEGGPETVQADGTNSLVNFSGLEAVSGTFTVTFEASEGGSNRLTHLIGGSNACVTLNPGGALPVAQIQQLGGITASNITVDFADLSVFDGGNISLSGGAAVTLPVLQDYNGGCGRFIWTVEGPGSLLNLPGLTNVTQPYCGTGGYIQAEAGGKIVAANLASIAELGDPGGVQVDGTNSLVNFSGLRTVSGAFTFTLEASDGGTNLVSQFIGGTNAYVTLNPGGALPVAQIQQLGGITASAGTANFASLASFDGGNISLSGGAVVTLPVLQDYNGGCGRFIWTVVGPGSVLNLPGLTNMTQAYCGRGGQIEAEAGGQILATNLAVIVQLGDPQTVEADGTNSLVDFSALESVSGPFTVTFETSDGGTNWVPHCIGGTNMFVTINAGGTMPVAQMRQLTGITASNVTVSFTSLTDIDGGSISVSGGAVVMLPALENYFTPNNGATWEVTGSGSALTMPALTNLLGPSCCSFNIDALAGGQLLLDNLGSVQDGSVSFLSDGTGSLINLSQLSRFVISTGQGQISAQDDGTILFNSQAFLLANVAINIPAGNPILPPTLIASPTLTLCGTAWDSYRIVEMNTLAPGTPVTVLLVPLTNAFQAIAAAAPPDTAFLITDFVANPPILQLTMTPDSQVQLVLFGLTNGTYQIQSTADLRSPITWTPGGVAAMTNAFRIFPEMPPAAVLQFYRAEQQ